MEELDICLLFRVEVERFILFPVAQRPLGGTIDIVNFIFPFKRFACCFSSTRESSFLLILHAEG